MLRVGQKAVLWSVAQTVNRGKFMDVGACQLCASMINQGQFQVPMESRPILSQAISNNLLQDSSMVTLAQQIPLLPLLPQCDDFDAYAKLLQANES